LSGPTIIIAQAGHIHSGGFDAFAHIAEIAQSLDAWVHVDGAFGLWARASAQYNPLTDQLDRADSWAVDGHKWLQTPYDTGFAIVRSADALHRSMTKSAGYLNQDEEDGRSNCSYAPELSRRARAFPVWAMIQALGR
jgi:glutamate/tyrosine decarboxylase-like PLP-dependent enzyme